MGFKESIGKIRNNLKDYPNVRVVGAVKYFDVDQTRQIALAGLTELGENRKEAFMAKVEALADLNITWHYFGTIKIPPKLNPQFIDSIDYLHSLDSIDLANAINKTRKKEEPLNCFVQVNIANVPSKAGLDETKVIPFIKNLAKYPAIRVVGLMTTGKNTFDEDESARYFRAMQDLAEEVRELNLPYAPCTELSMGMSNDYKVAVKHGATFVRLGQALKR